MTVTTSENARERSTRERAGRTGTEEPAQSEMVKMRVTVTNDGAQGGSPLGWKPLPMKAETAKRARKMKVEGTGSVRQKGNRGDGEKSLYRS
mgnify:CR=1 FL=1